ncbi:hypothetical protein DPMN_045491 [Dreissena polymorpha]|uniref:Uncharacterized protein n=1 Tax=Dreissena polymorpha TaxID=45954 RepID=A0A9D4D685_DREPO|nr:hypothetical protein DPMN_045458 [Dreissena polymorpha]KAH3738848.1 hypothetical protein DPMN_045491 [Dreissena polymorpha]
MPKPVEKGKDFMEATQYKMDHRVTMICDSVMSDYKEEINNDSLVAIKSNQKC